MKRILISFIVLLILFVYTSLAYGEPRFDSKVLVFNKVAYIFPCDEMKIGSDPKIKQELDKYLNSGYKITNGFLDSQRSQLILILIKDKREWKYDNTGKSIEVSLNQLKEIYSAYINMFEKGR